MSTSPLSPNDGVHSITVRPEDVLLACVAYTRPEMLTLNKIIALRSQNALVINSSAAPAKSIADLPTELLLRIRADLQSTLFASLKTEAATALEEYQAALVEGICPDCFWWNSDVYGADIWSWVENGYRGACSCVVIGDNDPRDPSEAKKRALKKFEGIDIGTRGQWLRTYIQSSYLGGGEKTTAWRFARSVLAEFGCTHCFDRKQSSCPTSAAPIPTGTDVAATASYGEPESKKTPRRSTPCDFGALVRISQSPEQRKIEEPAITIGRLLRELDLKAPADDEPSIALQSSATQFVDKIHRRTACARHFLAQRGPAGSCFDCLAIFAAPAMSLTSTMTSLAFGAASVAYLVARVAF